MKSERPILILAILVVIVVIAGEAVVYTSNTGSFGSDATLTSSGIDYTVSSDGADTYDAILMDNGAYENITELYIYYDETYTSNIKKVTVAVGAKELTQDYYIKQLVNNLKYLGFENTIILNAQELKDAMTADLSNGNYSKGLVVISGALPEPIYSGNSTDTIFTWMDQGGRLYWAGNLIGAYYATTSGVVDVPDYQDLFFGTECLNTSDTNKAYSDYTANDLRYQLSMMNNRVAYAIDPGKLTGDYISLGYTEDGYVSATIVEYGEKGMICVIGGDYSNNQRIDLSQIISSGLCCNSRIIDSAEGDVIRTTISGSLEIESSHGNLVMYVYLGGYYTVYGNTFYFS